MTNRVKGEVSPKGCTARKPGHAALAVAGFLAILGPEAENGHAQIGVALDRNEDGIAGSALRSRLPSDEKLPRDNPTVDVAVADREPELVEAEVLALTAVAEALVALAFAAKTTNWVAVTVGGWNELKAGGDGTARGWRNGPDGGTSEREHKDGVRALAADQNIEVARWPCPPRRSHWASRELPLWPAVPTPRSSRCLAAPRISTIAVGEGHHDLPARQRPARPPPAGRRTPRWRRHWESFRSNRTRSPPAVTA